MQNIDISKIEFSDKDIEQALERPGKAIYWGDNKDMFETWTLGPVVLTRDSSVLEQSNCYTLLKILEDKYPQWENDYSIERTSHFLVGWVDHLTYKVLTGENDTQITDIAKFIKGWFDYLNNQYPIADEDDFCEREQDEADNVWKDCYNVKERINYIRDNRNQFEFRSMQDMLACVRGNYFAGYASELIG